MITINASIRIKTTDLLIHIHKKLNLQCDIQQYITDAIALSFTVNPSKDNIDITVAEIESSGYRSTLYYNDKVALKLMLIEAFREDTKRIIIVKSFVEYHILRALIKQHYEDLVSVKAIPPIVFDMYNKTTNYIHGQLI